MVYMCFVTSLVATVLPIMGIVACLVSGRLYSLRVVRHIVTGMARAVPGVLLVLRMPLTLVVFLVIMMFHSVFFHSNPLPTIISIISTPQFNAPGWSVTSWLRLQERQITDLARATEGPLRSTDYIIESEPPPSYLVAQRLTLVGLSLDAPKTRAKHPEGDLFCPHAHNGMAQ
jgi:hypothetical protein